MQTANCYAQGGIFCRCGVLGKHRKGKEIPEKRVIIREREMRERERDRERDRDRDRDEREREKERTSK